MLTIEYKKTGELIPYINNSRTHSEKQVQQVAASIKEFGFTNPILIDEGNGIIAGHGRLQAAQMLNLNEVPTITLEGLTEAQRKAYVIADNQLAMNAGWDLDALKVEVDRLTELDFNLDLLGFDDDLLKDLLSTIEPNFDPATEEEQGQLDELDPKWIDCPHCGKEFDMRGQV
jgi:ParB family transcriptional regulator, chromosome partitioning protein